MNTREQEPAKGKAKNTPSRVRFDSKKELRLTGLTHQFLSRTQTHWSLLFEKLSLLQDAYKDQLAMRLCRRCLCFYNCKLGVKHEDITINSLFKLFDFKLQTASDLVNLLKEHGRAIRNFSGEELIGFPGFNLECGDDYYFAPDQTPTQVQLSESVLETISIISRMKSEQGDLRKRNLSSSFTNMSTDVTEPKKKFNQNATPIKEAWVPSGIPKIPMHHERLAKSANKQSTNKGPD